MAYSNYYLNQRISNLQYEVDQIVNPITGYVPIQGNSNIGGIKTFVDEPPQTPHPPILGDDIVNKTYVDSLVPTPLNAVLIDGNQTLGTGIKTFVNLPQSATVPVDDDDLVNKLYVDSQVGGGITINDVLTNTLPFTATQTFNNTIIANSLITGNITNADTSTVSLNSKIGAGGSGVNYLTMTAGNVNNGTYPLLVNLPTYNATSTVLSAPIIDGTSYITSPLLTTTPNGTVRIASSTGQYSYFQQSSSGAGYDLNLFIPPAGGLFHLNVGGVANLPLANAETGVAFSWNSTNGDGATDIINYAQGSPTGGFNFYNVNGSTNSTLIASIQTAQPPLNDVSVNLATTKWVSEYVGSIPSSGLTLAQVHSSILPFTAIQTFNFDNIVSGITVGTGGGSLNTNVAVGLDALSTNSTGNNNVAIGKNSLKNELGTAGQVLTITSTSTGVYTGATIYSGVPFNLIISGGGASVDAVATCIFTSFLGLGSYSSTITLVSGGSGYTSSPTITFPIPAGLVETAPATCSFTFNTVSGSFNTCIGANSNLNQTEGDYNSSFGYNAGSNISTGSYNTCIGNNAIVPNPANDHQIVIGTSSDTTFISGGLNITSSTSPTLFTGSIPQCSTSSGVNLTDIANVQLVQNLLSSFRNIIPLKATSNSSLITGDKIYTLTINSWQNYLIDGFITLRYNLSNNFTAVAPTIPSSYTANSWGYCDIYPYRLGFGSDSSATQNFSVLNNSFNGSPSYDLTNGSLPRGRWFWAYDNNNLTSYGTNPSIGANGFYLYLQSMTTQQLNIALYLPTPTLTGAYSSSFNIELLSSLNSNNISTSGFNISNF